MGGEQDRELAARIGVRPRQSPMVAAGDTPLLTSLALIAASDLFIGNDSGPLHAAAALGRPYVALFGPTAEANFHPLNRYAEQDRVLQPARPCGSLRYFVGGRPIWQRGDCCRGACAALATIDVETIAAAADGLLLSRRDVATVR